VLHYYTKKLNSTHNQAIHLLMPYTSTWLWQHRTEFTDFTNK